MNLHFLILFLFSLLSLSAAAAGRRGPLLGGWNPIEDVTDPHVREIGEFAVTEYDKNSKAGLKFESVIKGETQVVSGINYRLVVAAKNGEATNQYQAVVYDKPWEKIRNLTSFKPVAKD